MRTNSPEFFLFDLFFSIVFSEMSKIMHINLGENSNNAESKRWMPLLYVCLVFFRLLPKHCIFIYTHELVDTGEDISCTLLCNVLFSLPLVVGPHSHSSTCWSPSGSLVSQTRGTCFLSSGRDNSLASWPWEETLMHPAQFQLVVFYR